MQPRRQKANQILYSSWRTVRIIRVHPASLKAEFNSGIVKVAWDCPFLDDSTERGRSGGRKCKLLRGWEGPEKDGCLEGSE